MLKTIIFILLFGNISNFIFAQSGKSDEHSANIQNFGYQIKISTIATLGGGIHMSAGWGLWLNKFDYQPSLNFNINYMVNRNNFGCRKAQNQNSLLNVVFSPILVIRCGSDFGRAAEINTFYYGYASGVLCNFKNYAAIGTNFVTTPKGSDKNIMTARNRSQQLLYLGGRVGWTDGYFMLNLYEDYFLLTNSLFQPLADNRDRFFTGGGNVQVNLNNQLTLKYYTEAYTGVSYTDHLQYPDLVYPFERVGNKKGYRRFFSGPERMRRFAYQDPGQNSFNQGRDLIVAEYSGGLSNNFHLQEINKTHYGKISIVYGWQGFQNDMWQQNLIHNAIKIDKYTVVNQNGKKEIVRERYHRFEPRSKLQTTDPNSDGNKEKYRKGNIIGLGIGYGIQ